MSAYGREYDSFLRTIQTSNPAEIGVILDTLRLAMTALLIDDRASRVRTEGEILAAIIALSAILKVHIQECPRRETGI